jgi:DNA-directed RNA polymerase subunit RPC12/RpoP
MTIPTAQTPAKPALPPRTVDRFSYEKAVIGGVTILTLQGTLNESFEGRKLAESIKTPKVVIAMYDVRRFASWGMSDWMDFLRINAQRDIYLIECATYAMSQINLITGLLGHAKLVSFYASYRCASCSEELRAQFLVPRDREAIRDLPGSVRECAACGGRARLEEYPAAFFETIAARPAFDIDDEVLAVLRSRFQYELAPDLTRFRALRATRPGYTYLRLSGSLGLLPEEVLASASSGTTVIDLGGALFHPAELAPWRAYLAAARGAGTSLQLLGCPLGFLESAVSIDDLRSHVKVRSLALPYHCLRCETQYGFVVDVAENLEQLAVGTAPAAPCPACQSVLVAALAPGQLAHLRALPARDRDPALEKFVAKARAEPAERLENCLSPGASVAAGRRASAEPSRRTLYIALGLAVVAVLLWLQRGEGAARPAVAPVVPAPAPPQFTRPDWILSDLPASAYCHEMINRLMCVGVSSYRTTRDDAVAEANDAALEELVHSIGLKITEPFFRETVSPAFSDQRAKAFAALQGADGDRASATYARALDGVRAARRRVAEQLASSGGAAAPTQRSDWYWEEYAGAPGKPNETLVFVRYDVGLDAMKALVARYSAITPLPGGAAAMTAFPAVAWQAPDFTGGAVITRASRALAEASLHREHIVVAVNDQRVADAPALARALEDAARGTRALAVTVKAGPAAPHTVQLRP